jgi:hypothetical protein
MGWSLDDDDVDAAAAAADDDDCWIYVAVRAGMIQQALICNPVSELDGYKLLIDRLLQSYDRWRHLACDRSVHR